MGLLHSRESLEGERNYVSSSAFEVLQRTIVNPKRDHDTSDDEELIEGFKGSATRAVI